MSAITGSAITGVGIDFGTTNSVLAIARADGSVESRLWPAPDGPPCATYRTALTFWREGRRVAHVSGPAAIARAADPVGEQRFVQSLKTYLASRAFADTRLYGARFTIEALVALFLRDLCQGHDQCQGRDTDHAAAGLAGVPVVSGRPVVFAGANADEALALERLRTAFAQAGLPAVDLAYEPLGAAYWYARDLRRDETVLVADFGGGTSDFSLLRFTSEAGRLVAVPLAHAGVGIAGDTFDARLIDHVVAPRLGKGATYRSFGKDLPIPAYVHAAFAQWHQLSWLKGGTILADLRKLAEASARGGELEDLITVVEMDMGLALYRAVSACKAALTSAPQATLHFAGHGLAIVAAVERADFEAWIADDLAAIDRAIEAVFARAGLRPGDVDAVFITGGTSYVPAVRRLFDGRFPAGRIKQGDAFQSVASGLALLAADRARAGLTSSAPR